MTVLNLWLSIEILLLSSYRYDLLLKQVLQTSNTVISNAVYVVNVMMEATLYMGIVKQGITVPINQINKLFNSQNYLKAVINKLRHCHTILCHCRTIFLLLQYCVAELRRHLSKRRNVLRLNDIFGEIFWTSFIEIFKNINHNLPMNDGKTVTQFKNTLLLVILIFKHNENNFLGSMLLAFDILLRTLKQIGCAH